MHIACSVSCYLWLSFQLLQQRYMNGLFSWCVSPSAKLQVWVLGKGISVNSSILCPVLFLYLEELFQIFVPVPPRLSTSFSLVDTKRLWWKRHFCFVFLFFTLVTYAFVLMVQHVRQSGWYGEEELKLERYQAGGTFLIQISARELFVLLY